MRRIPAPDKHSSTNFRCDGYPCDHVWQRQDVLQEVVIWGRKHYRLRPLLCHSDGEIGVYRRYCRQFYPDRPDCVRMDEAAGSALLSIVAPGFAVDTAVKGETTP